MWQALRTRYFSTGFDALLSVLCVLLIVAIVPDFLRWAFVDATWHAADARACGGEGACWGFVHARFGQFMTGTYPEQERWRIAVAALGAVAGIGWLMRPGLPAKRWIAAAMLTVYPVAAGLLLAGGVFGLAPVPTARWGGLTLTCIVAAWGIVTSIPLGMVLALARRSDLPVMRWSAIAFIEFWRGVPLIGILFMASTMFPLLVPPGVDVDKLLRALIGFTLFNSAYMAETFRGGLQAIPKGQYEAANALGLPARHALASVILPQAIRISLPSLVNNCITIFKVSSVFLAIGLFELLGMVQAGTTAPEWLGNPQVIDTGYVFAAAIYWVFCYGMSRYSRSIEKRGARAAR
jgi:general L-amino acid transport system permease protein